MSSIKCTDSVQAKRSWATETHFYTLSDEKLKRLNKTIPADADREAQKKFYIEHADIVTERHAPVPVIKASDFPDFPPYGSTNLDTKQVMR